MVYIIFDIIIIIIYYYRDHSKTDYTYAHSFSYSTFVPLKDRFAWIVPNMSRPSISHYSNTSSRIGSDVFLDKKAVTHKIVGNIPVSKLNQSSSTSSSRFNNISTIKSQLQTSTSTNNNKVCLIFYIILLLNSFFNVYILVTSE